MFTKKQQETLRWIASHTPEKYQEYKEMFEKRQNRKAEQRKRDRENALEVMKTVKVGDVFSSSWGYEQTNVNFFQVVELVGKSSVRIREVYPEMIDEKSGFMCADRVYKIPQDGTLLPAASRSSFIKDNEKGDIKRVHSFGEGCPAIKLSSFAYAHKETDATSKHYESWYA